MYIYDSNVLISEPVDLTQWEFLTMRPWAERGSWFTRGFFFVLYATRAKLSLDQILSHATCDVYSPKAVETLINLISDTDFRGKKIKNPAFVKNYIFSPEI